MNDNGPGISDEALPYIFETFYRAEGSRNIKTGGTGLGLTIARQIVEGHQGSICTESILGKGTTIYVILPLEKDDNDEKNINY
jgi:histidine kinase